ncbi:hypothetical protein Lal_00012781 [Lupinus albus]|nr:hypothetical protein Lal_00012781 [Lupinus albus]
MEFQKKISQDQKGRPRCSLQVDPQMNQDKIVVSNEFFRVCQCLNAKEMWDTLQVTHKGTSEVKRARLNALSHDYKLFCMFSHESICDMQKRFTHIVNHLVALDRVFDIGDLTNKVLRCLSRKWQPKVTAIMESKNVDSMSLATLFGKLQEHEMELQRLTLHEKTVENVKKISFKATKSHSRSQEVRSDHEESDFDIDDETVSQLVNKFRKFLRKKGGFRKFHKEDAKD